MKCPVCGDIPVTFKDSFIINKEKMQDAQRGIIRCSSCKAELTNKTNRFGMTEFKSPFYVYFSLFLITMITLTWAFLFNYDQLLGDISPLFGIAGAVVLMGIAVTGATKIAVEHRYLIVFDPKDEVAVDKKTSLLGFILLLAYAVLVIFGFGYLNDLALEEKFNSTLTIILSIVYLGITILIAFLIYKVTIHDKAAPVE